MKTYKNETCHFERSEESLQHGGETLSDSSPRHAASPVCESEQPGFGMTVSVFRFLPCSTVNGPGKRFTLWVQGCAGVPQLDGVTRHCGGCWNRHTWSKQNATVISVDEMLAHVLKARDEHGVEGVTFSGGEPFQQAGALGEVARRCQDAGLSVMVFTGYTHEFLLSESAPHRASALLRCTDLLVDGAYTQTLRTETLPLRGSTNQRLVPLNETGRALADRVTSDLPIVEFNFTTKEAVVTGFPRK